MPPLTLTWDLIVVVFFALVVVYSFIVGRDAAMKIAVSAVLAVVAVQGIGNAIALLAPPANAYLAGADLALPLRYLPVFKIALLAVAIVALSLRAGFRCNGERTGAISDLAFTAAFAVATAGLLLIALITFLAGKPLLDPSLSSADAITPLLAQSTLLPLFVAQQDLWYVLPGFLLLLCGFLGKR